MTGFDKTWTRPESVGLTEKLRETVKPQGALKPRIEQAVNKLQGQISKMDSMLGKLRERDAQLFKRIVAAMQHHDAATSRVLSNELAEIRKVSKMLGNARMALEQVQLRLTTIHDLGDAMVAMAELQFNENLRIGYAYDITISPLKYYNNGSHELLFRYEVGKNRSKVKSTRYF